MLAYTYYNKPHNTCLVFASRSHIQKMSEKNSKGLRVKTRWPFCIWLVFIYLGVVYVSLSITKKPYLQFDSFIHILQALSSLFSS